MPPRNAKNRNSKKKKTIPKSTTSTNTTFVTYDPKAKLLQKANERTERIKRNHLKAEQLAQSGDEFLEKGDHVQAVTCYIDAIDMWKSNTRFYTKLVTACVKAQDYESATILATKVLHLNPRDTEARYQRGLASLEQDLFKAAHIDFNTILTHVPNHTKAVTVLDNTINARIFERKSKKNQNPSASPNLKFKEAVELAIKFDSLQSYDDDQAEQEDFDVAELSDSEECEHVGNGIPCRHYNRKESGCLRGLDCAFKHAPDDNSERDKLGRNVCIYFLLGSCRYQEKCVYSHDREWLPEKGWWTSSVQMERMRTMMMTMVGKYVKGGQKALFAQLKGSSTTSKRTSSNATGKRIDSLWSYDKDSDDDYEYYDYYGNSDDDDSDDDDEFEERMANFGFSRGEVEELMCQGVNPWDEDARDVLAVLYDKY